MLDNYEVFWFLFYLVEHVYLLLLAAGAGLVYGLVDSKVSVPRGLALGSLAGVGATVVSVVIDFFGAADWGLIIATVLLVVLVCRLADRR